MLSYKSAVCYIPGEGERRLNDNYYFNSKVITEELSSSRIKLAQKTEKSGVQVFGICSGSFSPSYDGSAATSVVNCLKKYHAAILREPEADVKPLLKEFCREASFAVSTRKKEGVERKAAIAAVIAADNGITVLNIGDVRIYRYDGNSVQLITEEHTQAYKMYEMGLLAESKIQFHPQRRKLTRYLGGSIEASAPALKSFECGGGETYVIIGSGANDCVNASLIKNVVKNNDSPAEIATEIAALCTDNEGEDRTVLVINTYGEPLAVVPAPVEKPEIVANETPEEDFFRNAVAADDVKNVSEDVAVGIASSVTAVEKVDDAMADTGFSDGADNGEKVNLFEQLENSDIDDDENNSAMDELFFNAAADEADEFSGVAFANSVTGKDFEDEVVFGGGITEDLEDAFDGGDEFDGAGIVKSNSKKQSATSEIGDAAKRFAGNDGDEEKEQIWPALVVFVVCLIFIILLCIFGIEMFKSGKDTKPSGDATNVPFVTQTPSGDSTDISSETPIETGTPAETETPSTDAPVSTNPPVINTDDVTMAPTATPTAEPTEAPASDVPETETPETDIPETETPETDIPATDTPETDAPATDVPETDVPVTDIPATDIPETEIPATDTPTEEPSAPTEVPSEEPSPESSADPADVGEGT